MICRRIWKIRIFFCDKFVVWYQTPDQLEEFRKVSDPYFTCIDRGGTFREFVPIGYSKATGIQYVLDYYHLDLDAAYAIGDSNNDLPMLSYVPNSVAMGNASPASLFDQVSFVNKIAASEDWYRLCVRAAWIFSSRDFLLHRHQNFRGHSIHSSCRSSFIFTQYLV